MDTHLQAILSKHTCCGFSSTDLCLLSPKYPKAITLKTPLTVGLRLYDLPKPPLQDIPYINNFHHAALR